MASKPRGLVHFIAGVENPISGTIYYYSVEKKNPSSSIRFWQVDALRGFAVVLMLAYHVFFDLNYLKIVPVPLHEFPFIALQRTTAVLFLTLVGVSFALSRHSWEKTASRFAFLASIAMLITAVTWVFPHDGFVLFGIIHLIALSVLLGGLFLRFDWLNLFFGLGLLSFGTLFAVPRLDVPWLLWLGFPPVGFFTLDYYPLIPWFGLVLIGIFVGKKIKNRLERHDRQMLPLERFFCYLGKNALLIYLIHQPVLVGLMTFYRMIVF